MRWTPNCESHCRQVARRRRPAGPTVDRAGAERRRGGRVRSTNTVAKQISEVEGFAIRFVTDGDDTPRQRVAEYPYERAAWDSWTVNKWRESRFWSNYPAFEVEVLKPDGSPAHGRTLLST